MINTISCRFPSTTYPGQGVHIVIHTRAADENGPSVQSQDDHDQGEDGEHPHCPEDQRSSTAKLRHVPVPGRPMERPKRETGAERT